MLRTRASAPAAWGALPKIVAFLQGTLPALRFPARSCVGGNPHPGPPTLPARPQIARRGILEVGPVLEDGLFRHGFAIIGEEKTGSLGGPTWSYLPAALWTLRPRRARARVRAILGSPCNTAFAVSSSMCLAQAPLFFQPVIFAAS